MSVKKTKMPETAPHPTIEQIDDPMARMTEADKAWVEQVGAKLGEQLLGGTIQLELPYPETPNIGDAKPSNTSLDTTNVATTNMFMDAVDVGKQTEAASRETIESQQNEAWDNHTGANAKQQLDEAEERSKQADAEMEATIEESMTDKLTGLKNREALELVISKVGIEGISGLALVDLNDFKGANDNFGHRAGDQVLQRFAALAQKRLSGDENMPGSELGEIFRTGGDEFAIAFYGGRKLEDIQQAITDIEAETSAITFGPEDNPLPEAKRTTWTAGSSIGFAPSNEFSDLSTGLSLADQDMFARKEANRPEGYVGRAAA